MSTKNSERKLMSVEEKEFLSTYDPNEFERPSIAVDIVIFTVKDAEEENYRKLPEKELKVLMVKRKEYPFKGYWALPGGFLDIRKTLEETAEIKLKEKINVEEIYIEQLYTWSDVDRDPRTRVISVSYIALIDSETLSAKAGRQIEEVKWISVKKIKDYKIGFDHEKLIEYGKERLKNKIEHTDIVFNLMPEYFTLTELQKVYEIILDKPLLMANFRRKVKDKVIQTEMERTGAGHRKAKLFKKNEDGTCNHKGG